MSERFLELLRDGAGRRRPLVDMRKAWLSAHPEQVQHPERDTLLLDALLALSAEGLLELPSIRSFESVGHPRMPKFVTLASIANTAPVRDWAALPWLPIFGFWPLLTLSELRTAETINGWMAMRRSSFMLVPLRERAFEIFGDEKYLDLRVRNEALFSGRLPLREIGAFLVAPPLPHRPADAPGRPILIVENHHTYWSLGEWNLKHRRYASVVYGAGYAVSSTGRALDEVMRDVRGRSVLYFGDIDPDGVRIPLKLMELGVEDMHPDLALYRLALEVGRTRASAPMGRDDLTQLRSWVPSLADRIAPLWERELCVPQESVGTELLLERADWLMAMPYHLTTTAIAIATATASAAPSEHATATLTAMPEVESTPLEAAPRVPDSNPRTSSAAAEVPQIEIPSEIHPASTLAGVSDQPPAIPMTTTDTPSTVQAPIKLACIEVSKFRRLENVRVDIDEITTILVGANNSGKTSILTALRNFLSDSPAFRPFDLSLSQWRRLRVLGKAWEELAEDPAVDAKSHDAWEVQLKELLDCMPFIDLWFDAKDGAYHHVAPFITSLKWSGGAVGVRLRLEPAASVEALQSLAWRYREARAPIKNMDGGGHAWPMDPLDYWLRHAGDLRKVAAYRLDPAKSPLASSTPSKAQELLPDAQPVDLVHVQALIRVDFVPAQRGLGSEDDEARSEAGAGRPGLFSSQLLKFARQHLNITTTGRGHREDLVQAIAKAQAELDEKIFDALRPSIEDVEVLGYPGLHDPQEIHFRTRIQTADLLAHGTAVQYRFDKGSIDESLPEHSIGLGYQNLQSLSYQLVSFRAARLAQTNGTPAAVHLVMVEEPEAHLHVQVQRNFSSKAHALICPKGDEYASLRSQLLISTHSSHLAHSSSFSRLRYVRRVARSLPAAMPSTQVVNLGDAFGTDIETRTFAERYFRVQHTDLLFADAAIFVEGTAERMLVPGFIEQGYPQLSKKYVSFLDIGGSHAHRLKPLVERLGIPTVIITDLDPVLPGVDKRGRQVRRAASISGQAELECGNATLTSWHPKLEKFSAFGSPKPEDLVWTSEGGVKVRFAWQLPVAVAGDQWPSSFEDSLALSNVDWLKGLHQGGKHKGALGKLAAAVADNPEYGELLTALHDLMHGGLGKGELAASLFEKMSAGTKITCPPYIGGALSWLQDQLKPTNAELM